MRRNFFITGVITPVEHWKKGGCYARVPAEWKDNQKVIVTPRSKGAKSSKVFPPFTTEIKVTTMHRAYVMLDCKLMEEHKIDEVEVSCNLV
jgi:hypothetical protein